MGSGVARHQIRRSKGQTAGEADGEGRPWPGGRWVLLGQPLPAQPSRVSLGLCCSLLGPGVWEEAPEIQWEQGLGVGRVAGRAGKEKPGRAAQLT